MAQQVPWLTPYRTQTEIHEEWSVRSHDMLQCLSQTGNGVTLDSRGQQRADMLLMLL